MLIQAYGLNWNPEFVEWKSSGQPKGVLNGKVKIKEVQRVIDFWEGHGLYVLHHEFRTVYVGRTTNRGLGHRLRDHLKDEFAGKWDSFSWFIVNRINISSGSLGKSVGRKLEAREVISILEALAIYVSDPPMNRKRERLLGSYKVRQANSEKLKTTHGYLMEILKRLPPVPKKKK